MGDGHDIGLSAPGSLERLMTKGRGLLELALELDKKLCVQGFVDAQIERGGAYLQVIEAMREHVDDELTASPRGRRRDLLLDLQRYIGLQLEAAQAIDEPIETR